MDKVFETMQEFEYELIRDEKESAEWSSREVERGAIGESTGRGETRMDEEQAQEGERAKSGGNERKTIIETGYRIESGNQETEGAFALRFGDGAFEGD